MTLASRSIEIVGAGRMGSALAFALREAGYRVIGPSGRGASAAEADIVLLAVPDAAITDAARRIAPGRLVGHLSGATVLEPLAPHERFSLHPLTSVMGAELAASPFPGAAAAVAGSTDRALTTARALAAALRMRPIEVADEHRAAYHAAASIASNFLVTLEGCAEDLAATVGVDRAALRPLVEATVSNWAAAGAARALTGPVARGDRETVAVQRLAVAERLPDRLALFDALVTATDDLARRQRGLERADTERGTEQR